MKKNVFFIGLLIAATFVLVQCDRGRKEKLEGIWRLQRMEINGTVLTGPSLGDWKWEFNEEGGFLTDVAGAREKGSYSLKGEKLKMKSVTHPERPEQIYTVAVLDSVQLELQDNGSSNKSSLHFLKMKGGAEIEKD